MTTNRPASGANLEHTNVVLRARLNDAAKSGGLSRTALAEWNTRMFTGYAYAEGEMCEVVPGLGTVPGVERLRRGARLPPFTRA